MADDPLRLGDERPDVLGAGRHREVQQLFHGPHVRVVVGHRADVVQPVGVGDDLLVGQALAQLLDAAMQVAEVRCGLHNALALEFQHHAEHPVRGRVLRAHIEQQFLLAPDRLGVLWQALGFFEEGPVLRLGNLLCRRRGLFVEPREKRERAAPAPALRREVLAQGVAFIVVLRHENAAQVRVARERDAHQVKDLPLQKVRAFPDRRDGRDGRVVFRESRLEAEPVVARERLEQVNDLEPVFILRVVHREHVREHVERGFGIVMEKTGDLRHGCRLDLRDKVLVRALLADRQHGVRESFRESGEQRVHRII